MLAPTALTPTGVAVQAGGGNADFSYGNKQGSLVRRHAQSRRPQFVPRGACPVQLQELVNYRKTIVKFIDKPNESNEQCIEEAWQSLSHKQQNRFLPGNIWRGETWFKVRPRAGKRYNEHVLKAQQGASAHTQHSKAAGKGKKQTTTSFRAEQQLAEAPTGQETSSD